MVGVARSTSVPSLRNHIRCCKPKCLRPQMYQTLAPSDEVWGPNLGRPVFPAIAVGPDHLFLLETIGDRAIGTYWISAGQHPGLQQLEQIREARAAGVPRGVVLIDASYGSNSALRASVSALALCYVAAIVPTVKVCAVSEEGELGERMSVKDLALSLPKKAWRKITWREG